MKSHSLKSNKKAFLTVFVIIISVNFCVDAKPVDVAVDLGRLFRFGMTTDGNGTGLGLNVLDGFVRVGFDRVRNNDSELRYKYKPYLDGGDGSIVNVDTAYGKSNVRVHVGK